jgi:CubicO group peptidase (beta-lactamase class C family)
MKHQVITLFLLLTMLLGTAAYCQTGIFAATLSGQEIPLRLSEPVDTVVADLQRYIPERMRQEGVPGLSIALIRDGKVVWTEGFGLANTITRKPVTAETVFAVASNSKVVAAYTALRLVEAGKLSLDDPLSAYLSEQWLPPSEYGNRITLRDLASHRSGLTDNMTPTVDKTVTFPPGSAFLYSGVGAMYLQEAIEQVTGRSLEDVARELVFEPLGMASSSFENSAAVRPHLANGHIAYRSPLLVFLIPFTVILACLGLVGVLILRFTTGRWRLTREMFLGACVVAGILTLLLLTLALGWALPNFLLLIALCGVGFIIVFAVTYLIVQRINAGLPATWQKANRQRALTVAWLVLSLVILLWLTGMIIGPVPKTLSSPPSAVGSLRTSASDLAAFLIELAEPQYLNNNLASQIPTPQVAIDQDFSWGLGPGIQHSEQGDALWQNGITFGFRSVMVIYPQQRTGVVVLTNSEYGLSVAYDVAQRALGGKARWIFF